MDDREAALKAAIAQIENAEFPPESPPDLATEMVLYLLDQRDELREENRRAWTERNEAYAKVKAWESVVYVEGLPLRSVSVDEWGPGEGGQTTVPEVTPKKLTELLDELARLRKAG
jgi:hypothetical protein